MYRLDRVCSSACGLLCHAQQGRLTSGFDMVRRMRTSSASLFLLLLATMNCNSPSGDGRRCGHLLG